MGIPSFLNKQSQVKIPVGGDFAPSGFIGQFFAAVVWSFYAKIEPDALKAQGVKYDGYRKQGDDGFRYYFKSQDVAKAAAKLTGDDKTFPGQMWHFEARRDSILNITSENLEKFSDPIVQELEIATLRSKKNRHKLHMIALPAAVAAMAKAYGYATSGFDLAELMSQDTLYTDDFEAKMVGTGDDYTTCALWQRRKTLWAELGETDATKYNPIPADAKDAGKFDTTAAKLSDTLGILAYEWQSPVWMRIINVSDPRVEAVSGGDKRLTIPIIAEIYADEAAARAAAATELAEREARKNGDHDATTTPAAKLTVTAPVAPAPTAAPVVTGNGKMPALPSEDWKGLEKELVDMVKGEAHKPNVIAAKAIGITVDQYVEWKTYVVGAPF